MRMIMNKQPTRNARFTLRFGCTLACTALLAVSMPCLSTQQSKDPLKEGFLDPPAAARPRVWWHWMNGNITREGIKLDEEWMHRAGLGGFQNFDASLFTPQVVDKRLAYMTPEWKDAFKSATTLADHLGWRGYCRFAGLERKGRPWVPPSQGMKKFVWSETHVKGGEPFTGTLAHPPSNTGPFQNLPLKMLARLARHSPRPSSMRIVRWSPSTAGERSADVRAQPK